MSRSFLGYFPQEVKSIQQAAHEEVCGIQIPSNTTRECLEDLQPCNHKEGNSHIFLHVLHAAKQQQRTIIRTMDTDVSRLLVAAVSQMQRISQKEVWLAFGMGKFFPNP